MINQNLNLFGPHRDFEGIKHLDENGIEFWNARELMPILGYHHWQKSEEVIVRAARACLNSGQVVEDHFNRTVKMVNIGSNTVREVKDWKLDRFACYLIAQNGDPFKPEIAQAQTEAKIRRENIRGQDEASQTHYMVGSKVRQTIKDIGGAMPERLPVEKHIKEVKKNLKLKKGK
jgi:hypothetical protein